MRSVNKVILIGNVTRDPQMKETSGGQSLCTFGIATNRTWVTRDGERKSLAEFHNIVAWSHLADTCMKILKKGKLVHVEGYLKTRVFEEENGEKSYRTEIVIHEMTVLSKRGDFEDTEGGYEEDSYADDYTSEAKEVPTEAPASEASMDAAPSEIVAEEPVKDPLAMVEEGIDSL